jgi:hypothetical protein
MGASQTVLSSNPLCAAKYLSDITAYLEFTFSTVESRTLTPSIMVRIQVPQPRSRPQPLRICSFLGSSARGEASQQLTMESNGKHVENMAWKDSGDCVVSKDGARACKQSGSFDVRCTRHFSRRSKSPILANLLSGPRYGTFGAGDRLVQTVRTIFALGRRPSHRAWHHLLASPGQKVYRVIARERGTVRPV